MKINIAYLLLLSLWMSFSCSSENDELLSNPNPPVENAPIMLRGFNMRWIDTQEFTDEALNKINGLKPQIMRYPGGTLAHKWDWRTGTADPSWPNHTNHQITDVKALVDVTGCKITFVVDIVNGTVQDQIEMLEAANVPIEYIELGNELYSSDYETIFPNGKVYAETINSWIPQLKEHFPLAKFGAVFIGRTAGDDRKNEWNELVHANILAPVDAYIYHLYVGETETTQERIARYDAVKILPEGKELWITEYGTRSQNVAQAIELADYIESIANLALNHCLVTKSGDFSKFEYGTNNYTEEGIAFLERLQ